MTTESWLKRANLASPHKTSTVRQRYLNKLSSGELSSSTRGQKALGNGRQSMAIVGRVTSSASMTKMMARNEAHTQYRYLVE